jgi:hypothetical protein
MGIRQPDSSDPNFSPDELTFRRYISDDFEGENFKPPRFSFPPSLNRQRYSEPEDVIFSETGEFDEHGVLECQVAQLSITVRDDRNTDYSFVPVHRPEENNYSHSEMWADCMQTRNRTDRPSKVARKKYRTIVSKRLSVRIRAKK